MAAAILASAELYDPASGTWSATGSLNTARYLSHGDVAAQRQGAGGRGSWYRRHLLTSAELYDPASGTWTATGSLNTARHFTRRRCCPTARCWWQGDSNAAAILSQRGTVRHWARIYAAGLAAANRDRDFAAGAWQQPHADRLAFPRYLASFRRELPGLIDQLPRSPTARHRQQPGRLSPGGSNSRLVRYHLYFDPGE